MFKVKAINYVNVIQSQFHSKMKLKYESFYRQVEGKGWWKSLQCLSMAEVF